MMEPLRLRQHVIYRDPLGRFREPVKAQIVEWRSPVVAIIKTPNGMEMAVNTDELEAA